MNIDIEIEILPTSLSVPLPSFVSMPPGGIYPQVLAKRSSDPFDAEWVNPPVGDVGDYDPGDMNLTFENQLI